jgi:hypothetical protein
MMRRLLLLATILGLLSGPAWAASCWTPPPTFTFQQKLTSAQLNTYLTNNTNCLDTAVRTDGYINRVKLLGGSTGICGNPAGGGTVNCGSASITGIAAGDEAYGFFEFTNAGNTNSKTVWLNYAGGASLPVYNSPAAGNQCFVTWVLHANTTASEGLSFSIGCSNGYSGQGGALQYAATWTNSNLLEIVVSSATANDVIVFHSSFYYAGFSGL